jgi:cathepsin H
MNFIAKFKRSYPSQEEYHYRLGIFTQNYHDVKSHNLKGKSYTKAINKFSDMTATEFKARLGYRNWSTEPKVYADESITSDI